MNLDDAGLLKQTILSSRALAELKGTITTIPNEDILLDTLVLSEAKSSSAIENIITTYEELFRANAEDTSVGIAAKEAKNYADAVKHGYELIKKQELLTVNAIKSIQQINTPQYAEIRKIPGTVLKNTQTGETIYTPPQSYDEIIELLDNLEKFINDPNFFVADPLIKMTIIHYQFESIHPFHDGNGRMGRILNVLYLIQQKLLNLPVLYLSKYIIEHKSDYYRLLQDVDKNKQWLEWSLWLIKGVEETAKDTTRKIEKIRNLMLEYKQNIRNTYNFYSQDLINVLFRYPYTKIKFIEKELQISRPTATRYLDTLNEGGFLKKVKLGRDNFYFNLRLFNILKGTEDKNV